MMKLLKELEIIKIAIEVENTEVIRIQILKLKSFLSNELNGIIVLLKKHQYLEATKLIDSFIERVESQKSIEWYAVSFIDILGQRNELVGLNNEDLTDTEAKKIIDDTYGNVKKLRKNIRSAFDGLTIDMSQGVYLHTNEVKINAFSDLVISYVSLKDDSTKKISMIGIYHLLLANSSVFLVMLSSEISLRGAIDIGRGLEHRLNECCELYGTALSNPYHLESEVAQNPRIVIGKRLYKHIYRTSTVVNDNSTNREYIRFAKESLNFIKKDTDGEYILDYLYVFSQHLEDFDKTYLRAKDFIDKSLITFKNDPKRKKYQYLKKYFNTMEITK